MFVKAKQVNTQYIMLLNISIKITWLISGYDNYGFASDKSLYNVKTGRKLKQAYNNRCIGYWFGRKFISLKQLKPLLYKPTKQITPF